MNKKPTPPAIAKYLSAIGSEGGKATGATKSRGDAAHYQKLSRKAARARKRHAKARAALKLPDTVTESTLTRLGKMLAKAGSKPVKIKGADHYVMFEDARLTKSDKTAPRNPIQSARKQPTQRKP